MKKILLSLFLLFNTAYTSSPEETYRLVYDYVLLAYNTGIYTLDKNSLIAQDVNIDKITSILNENISCDLEAVVSKLNHSERQFVFNMLLTYFIEQKEDMWNYFDVAMNIILDF